MTDRAQPGGLLPRVLWFTLLLVLIVLPNLFAVWQYRATGGYLFYANAFDEATYLSYDGASIAASPAHLAEYLVVGLHRLGLSGGWINLMFDIVCPTIAVVFLRRLAVAAGFSLLEATVYPFAVIATPILFGYTNPYYATLFDANYHSQGLSWITLPQAYYPPWLRTPEPQLSLCVIAIVTWVGLRRRSYVLPIAVSPFLYPFVGIPYTFIVLALFIDQFLPAVRRSAVRSLVAIVTSYVAIAVVLRVGHSLLIAGTELAEFLPATRLPLLSGTGTVVLIVYALARSRLEPSHRAFALFLSVAPLVVVNTQLLTGFFEQPNNFEQNFGVVALAIVGVLAIRTMGRGRLLPLVSAAASCVLLAAYASHIFVVNASLWQRQRLSDSLLDALRRQPESLVIGDPDLADLFALVAPRIHFSALARSQALPDSGGSGRGSTEQRLDNYLCVKRLLSASHPPVVKPDVFVEMNRLFRFLGQDFPLTHLNRRQQFRQYFDPSREPKHCFSRELQIFPALTLSEELGRVNLPTAVATPLQQWAYAAQVQLPEQTSQKGRPGKRIDVRITLAVTGGCVGAGVLTPDQRTFVSHAEMISSPATQLADLVFDETDEPHWLVLRNCSAGGASTALVHQTQIFRVDGVTVRPLTDTVPPV